MLRGLHAPFPTAPFHALAQPSPALPSGRNANTRARDAGLGPSLVGSPPYRDERRCHLDDPPTHDPPGSRRHRRPTSRSRSSIGYASALSPRDQNGSRRHVPGSTQQSGGVNHKRYIAIARTYRYGFPSSRRCRLWSCGSPRLSLPRRPRAIDRPPASEWFHASVRVIV